MLCIILLTLVKTEKHIIVTFYIKLWVIKLHRICRRDQKQAIACESHANS